VLFDGGTGHLRRAVVRYGGGGSNSAGIYSDITVRDTLAGEVLLESCQVLESYSAYHTEYGLYVNNGRAIISDTLFSDNGNGGAAAPFYIAGADSFVAMTGNAFTGNSRNRIVLADGAMTAQDVALGPHTGLQGYELTVDHTVLPAVTWTLEPGTVFFGQSGVELAIKGDLQALGTAVRPITLTSLTDTGKGQWSGVVFDGGTGHLRNTEVRYGGQGNSVGANANITVRNTTTGEVLIEDCRVRDSSDDGVHVAAGQVSILGTSFTASSVHVHVIDESAVVVDDSTIENATSHGVLVEGDAAWVRVTDTNIRSNGGFAGDGVRNTGEATVILSGDQDEGNFIAYNQDYGANQTGLTGQIIATYNYWGDPSGPTHSGNPAGMGEEVSDRVLYEPWLTEVPTETVGVGTLIESVGPRYVSPGETVNLGFIMHNVLTETLENVVVVAQLPEEGEYVLSWPSGDYWFDRHQVVWKLENVAPGEVVFMGVQMHYVWGLAPHLMTHATGLIVAENLPNELLDLDEYLAYEEVTVTDFDELSAQELQDIRDVEPDLDALFVDSEDLGFVYYGGARIEQLSDGSEQISVPLLDRTQPGEQIFIQQVISDTYRLHNLPSSAIVDSPGTSFSYEYPTKWVEMLSPFLGQSALIFATAQARSTLSGCDDFSFFDCLRNCLIANVPAHQFSPSYSQACFECYKAGGDACSTCAAHMESYRNDSLQRSTQRCQDRCSDNADWGKCDSDTPARECKTSNIVMVTPCDDCEFQPQEMTYESCHAGERCISGICTPIKPPDTHDTEVLVAGDPNAMHGLLEAAAGQMISYTIEYENVGEGTAYAVYVESQLPELFDPASLQAHDGGVFFASTRTLLWHVGELASGAGGEVSFSVQVPLDAVSGTVIIANATVYFPSVPETTPTNDVVTVLGDVVAHAQRVETVEGTAVPVTLTGHTPTGNPLAFAVVVDPLNGALSGSPPDMVYTPADGFEGGDRFSFRVGDGVHTSLPAEVAIEVSTGVETIPPEVLFTLPGDDATGVRVYETPVLTDTYHPTIWVQFTEPISAATVTTGSLFVKDGQGHLLSGDVVYDGTMNRARFILGEPLAQGGIYAVTVTTGVHDTSGNAMAADYEWSFRTVAYQVYLPLVVRQG